MGGRLSGDGPATSVRSADCSDVAALLAPQVEVGSVEVAKVGERVPVLDVDVAAFDADDASLL